MLAQPVEDETDEGPRSVTAARAPLSRLCLATRQVTPVTDMIRFVVGPDGTIVPDLTRKLPGRGAWVCATRGDLETALKRKAFGRAFKGKGKAGPELVALVDTLLDKDARASLSLANKAGQVVTGNAKVESALCSGSVAVLLHAGDARPDGVRKLNALARQIAATSDHEARHAPMAIVDCFPGIDLDLALGRSNVVHAALLAHPTTAGFLARCRRLERWRTGSSVDGERGAGPVSSAQAALSPSGEDQNRTGEDSSRAPGRMQGTDKV
ncbi:MULTISPECIES: RNA-binding protein [unclassified Xanthobacter]|uniref:RNA-binding protein n=1 Tax=unclassified Xanthobacter TaxID=2623496 RepID=UPI001EDE16E2